MQPGPNTSTVASQSPAGPMPALLQQICLTRSQLEKLESNFAKFEDFKNLVQGCFVRIMFYGHYLVCFYNFNKIIVKFKNEIFQFKIETFQFQFRKNEIFQLKNEKISVSNNLNKIVIK